MKNIASFSADNFGTAAMTPLAQICSTALVRELICAAL